MTDEQALERLIVALESIAQTMRMEYDRRYPQKVSPPDVDISYTKTEEEALRESLGETGEATVEDWTSLGPRERAFVAREEAERKR